MLVEQGRLDLDTDINTYLPFKITNPHSPKTPITLRHLATHTSGINDGKNYNKAYWIVDKESAKNRKYTHKSIRKEYRGLLKNEPISMQEYLKNFFVPNGAFYSKKNFFKRSSGEAWYYSNVGATLAAYIVELVSGQPFDEYVEQHIFKPLKLNETSWNIPIESNKLAIKYDRNKSKYPEIQGATYPDGAVYMSTSDLSKHLIHLMNGYQNGSVLLTKSSYREMMSVQYEEKNGRFKGIKNGLFWWHFDNGRMGHNGGSYGGNINLFFYPDINIGYTSFENVTTHESEDIIISSQWIRTILNRYTKYFK